MTARRINWLLYKNKITSDGMVNIGIRGGMVGMSRKNQIVLGKHVGIDGWLTVGKEGQIVIGDYSSIGARSVIQASKKIEVGSYTLISPDVWIQDSNNHSIYAKDRMQDILGSDSGIDCTNTVIKPIKIGNHVWIGRRSMILKGVTINDRSIVAAGSIVTHNVPPDSIVAGNPAKVVKQINQKPVSPPHSKSK